MLCPVRQHVAGFLETGGFAFLLYPADDDDKHNEDEGDQQHGEHPEYLFQSHFALVLFQHSAIIAEPLRSTGG